MVFGGRAMDKKLIFLGGLSINVIFYGLVAAMHKPLADIRKPYQRAHVE
jgi:hypothetical protein